MRITLIIVIFRFYTVGLAAAGGIAPEKNGNRKFSCSCAVNVHRFADYHPRRSAVLEYRKPDNHRPRLSANVLQCLIDTNDLLRDELGLSVSFFFMWYLNDRCSSDIRFNMSTNASNRWCKMISYFADEARKTIV